MKTATCPKTSPWGKIQGTDLIAPGIWSVSTASHGGIKLDAEHNRRMPVEMRHPGGWYEEDCDWCLPFIVFQAEIMEHNEEYATKAILAGQHVETFRNWHPRLFEQWFDTTIKPGESYCRDKELFFTEHKNDYIVVAAWGTWHKNVPAGLVGVFATIAGSREPGTAKIMRLVPEDEYHWRHQFGFVLDPDKYQVWQGPDSD